MREDEVALSRLFSKFISFSYLLSLCSLFLPVLYLSSLFLSPSTLLSSNSSALILFFFLPFFMFSLPYFLHYLYYFSLLLLYFLLFPPFLLRFLFLSLLPFSCVLSSGCFRWVPGKSPPECPSPQPAPSNCTASHVVLPAAY